VCALTPGSDPIFEGLVPLPFGAAENRSYAGGFGSTRSRAMTRVRTVPGQGHAAHHTDTVDSTLPTRLSIISARDTQLPLYDLPNRKQLRQSIASRLQELRAEIAKFEDAKTALSAPRAGTRHGSLGSAVLR
jgi:hypothetical protein